MMGDFFLKLEIDDDDIFSEKMCEGSKICTYVYSQSTILGKQVFLFFVMFPEPAQPI